ncbi:hypothetical protein JJL56_28195 [Azospirillum sp. YIM DDC1]|uniref:Lipoprotein n=1 Tax=Azospirillum aestuarii TaxID=2802052 RepID=A0ABS1I6R0_9PROT|nr:hypothetical protein [Azospirillum aestuarii]MBK4722742.1 hypothetical protein [Azospirillum aestuarii]
MKSYFFCRANLSIWLSLLLIGCQPTSQSLRTGLLGTEIGLGTPTSLNDLAEQIGGERKASKKGEAIAVDIKLDRWSRPRLSVIDSQFDAWCSGQGGKPTTDLRSLGIFEAIQLPRPARGCQHPDNGMSVMVVTGGDVTHFDGFPYYRYGFYTPEGIYVYALEVKNAELEKQKQRNEEIERAIRIKENAKAQVKVFRERLKPGDVTDKGMIVEMKRPIALVQHCVVMQFNLVRARCADARLEWMRIEDLYPRN